MATVLCVLNFAEDSSLLLGSLKLERKRKTRRFQMGTWRIQFNVTTRMHSSRMPTARFSGRLGGVCLSRGCLPRGVCPGEGVSAWVSL